MGWFHFMSGRGAGKMFGRGADFIFDAETYKPLAPQDVNSEPSLKLFWRSTYCPSVYLLWKFHVHNSGSVWFIALTRFKNGSLSHYRRSVFSIGDIP